MKTPNLNYLIQQQQRNQRLKTIVNKLANQIILDFDINDGYQMAYFLNLGQGLDNYTAIRKWAEKWLKTHYPVFDSIDTLNDLQHDDTLYSELKEQFLNHFPQTATA
ncbi:hypothetical protein [Faucicola atlantae]|uniref:Uncharacterized protein n=1 Tax=Faucicola atlantae TaxID=34059 RepID=A0A1B8QDM5_9GAMM|nr:hypothetical protein [Moraxella atlantae]OBX79726.1 hypothetical protein A9306_08345 [Moraxella atlantae]